MKLGFVSAICPNSRWTRFSSFGQGRGLRLRRADVLAARQGRAALRRRHPRRRRRLRPRRRRPHPRGRGQRPGVAISGLGYYPNPLAAGPGRGEPCVEHLKQVIAAAANCWAWGWSTRSSAATGPSSVDDNWPRFLEIWRPLIKFAEEQGVRIGIENCPMLFTARRMARRQEPGPLPGDLAADVRGHPQPEFRPELRPVAPGLAADGLRPAAARVRAIGSSTFTPRTPRSIRDQLDDVGILATPLEYHGPSCPGWATSTGARSSRPDRHRLPWPGLHRGGRPRVRGLDSGIAPPGTAG